MIKLMPIINDADVDNVMMVTTTVMIVMATTMLW